MIERIRHYFRDESPGIAVPVGFILLYALWSLLYSAAAGLVYPFVLHVFQSDPQDFRLAFHIGNVLVDLSTPFIYGVTFPVLVAVLYLVFVRGRESDNDFFELRECPACKSDVYADATRCAFCTSQLEPLSEADNGEGVVDD